MSTLKLFLVAFLASAYATDIIEDLSSSPRKTSCGQDSEFFTELKKEIDSMNTERIVWNFLHASFEGELEAVKFLREKFGSEIIGTKEMNEALKLATSGDRKAVLDYLMTCPQKTMIEQHTVNGALFNATRRGSVEIVQYFTKPNAEIKPNSYGLLVAFEVAYAKESSENHDRILRHFLDIEDSDNGSNQLAKDSQSR